MVIGDSTFCETHCENNSTRVFCNEHCYEMRGQDAFLVYFSILYCSLSIYSFLRFFKYPTTGNVRTFFVPSGESFLESNPVAFGQWIAL